MRDRLQVWVEHPEVAARLARVGQGRLVEDKTKSKRGSAKLLDHSWDGDAWHGDEQKTFERLSSVIISGSIFLPAHFGVCLFPIPWATRSIPVLVPSFHSFFFFEPSVLPLLRSLLAAFFLRRW